MILEDKAAETVDQLTGLVCCCWNGDGDDAVQVILLALREAFAAGQATPVAPAQSLLVDPMKAED